MDLFEEYSKDELCLTDIRFLGLVQKAWDYSRGARTERLYTDAEDNLRIKDSYSYTYENGNRDIATLSRKIEWFHTDGTVGLTKDYNSEQTAKSLAELNQTIRNGRIKDLFANAETVAGGTTIVTSLYAWYGSQIEEYIDRGTLSFETALINEADPDRRSLLETVIPEFGGLTVEQLLSFQLVGEYTWPA